MNHPSKNMECGNAEGSLDCGAQLKRFWKERILVSSLETNHSYDTLAMNVAIFPSLENLTKAKLKSFELRKLIEEISRHVVISDHSYEDLQ